MQNKLGFHYFADHLHYQEKDLLATLPDLKALGAAWLVLKAPTQVAIPESFISALLEAGITPVLDFDLRVDEQVRPVDLQLLLETYEKWGVRYVNFFRAPNMRSSWVDEAWALGDCVQRFLERWVPFLRMAQQCHLVALFPALQPGGDYWDLAFLKRVLALAQTKHLKVFAEDLHMAISAQSFGKPITWGAGASAAWKFPMPYLRTADGEEDHQGFNTWQWYTEIVKSMTGQSPKILLFWAGSVDHGQSQSGINFKEIETLLNERAADGLAMPLPDKLLAICYFKQVQPSMGSKIQPSLFSPLTEEQTQVLDLINEAIAKSRAEVEEKLDGDTQPLPEETVDAPEELHAIALALEATEAELKTEPPAGFTKASDQAEGQSVADAYRFAPQFADWVFTIDHYFLLPSYAWGVPENTFSRMLPILRDEKPTVGFSVAEAANARKVTIWNENQAFSEEDIQFLLNAGCIIDEQVIQSVGLETD